MQPNISTLRIVLKKNFDPSKNLSVGSISQLHPSYFIFFEHLSGNCISYKKSLTMNKVEDQWVKLQNFIKVDANIYLYVISFLTDGGPSLLTSASFSPVKLSRRRILQRQVRPQQRPRLLKNKIWAET